MSDNTPKFDPAKDQTPPVFDTAEDDLPVSPQDALNINDDGNILPGNDPLDEDPNDNGSKESADPEDLPDDAGRLLDPNMRQSDILP
ncbi:MAG: hypothetical protein ABI832_18355 [bacterium]